MINTALRYAVSPCRLIRVNPAEVVLLPKTVEAKPYHTRNIDTAKTLNMEQISLLLEASRETPIHMQVLFNVMMGLRRQEIITMDVYGDNANIILEEIPELLEYMDEVIPKKPDADNAETKVLDTEIDVEAFLGTKEKTGA